MNRIFSIAFVLVLFYGAASCSDPVPTDIGDNNRDTTQKDTLRDSAVFAGKDYDKAKGGVQIVKVYFSQDSNETLWGFKDEVVLLMSDKPTSLADWTLDASDNQVFALPDIQDSLFIYTHQAKGRWPHEHSLNYTGSSHWIWNNSDPDVATLRDGSGKIIDTFSYDR